MNVIIHLALKDLLRVYKNPIGVLIMVTIPLALALLMNAAFGSGRNGEARIEMHIAVLDRDDDVLSNMLRGASNQGGDGSQLVPHVVDSFEDGVRMLENRQASALIVFPENFTSDLLDGEDVVVEFYPNPAEIMLPRVAEQGADIAAVIVSETLALIGPEARELYDLFDDDEFPDTWTTAMFVYNAMQKMEAIETYVFPPIVQIDFVDADDYIPSASRTAKEGS